jgi:hypothetical protein
VFAVVANLQCIPAFRLRYMSISYWSFSNMLLDLHLCRFGLGCMLAARWIKRYSFRVTMKKAKPEHRRDYWKYHVAAHSFDQARDVALHLQRISNVNPIFYPLMISLHVLYGRPFRHPKESRNVESAFVPDELSRVHNTLLQMRDRIFAHHDKESRIKDAKTGVDLFQLIVVVQHGEIRPGVQTIFPTEFQLGKVQNLCEHLYRICMSNANNALIKCVDVPLSDGIYRVSTDFDNRTPLFIRSEFSAEQSRGHLKETIRRMTDSTSHRTGRQ